MFAISCPPKCCKIPAFTRKVPKFTCIKNSCSELKTLCANTQHFIIEKGRQALLYGKSFRTFVDTHTEVMLASSLIYGLDYMGTTNAIISLVANHPLCAIATTTAVIHANKDRIHNSSKEALSYIETKLKSAIADAGVASLQAIEHALDPERAEEPSILNAPQQVSMNLIKQHISSHKEKMLETATQGLVNATTASLQAIEQALDSERAEEPSLLNAQQQVSMNLIKQHISSHKEKMFETATQGLVDATTASLQAIEHALDPDAVDGASMFNEQQQALITSIKERSLTHIETQNERIKEKASAQFTNLLEYAQRATDSFAPNSPTSVLSEEQIELVNHIKTNIKQSAHKSFSETLLTMIIKLPVEKGSIALLRALFRQFDTESLANYMKKNEEAFADFIQKVIDLNDPAANSLITEIVPEEGK